MGGDWLTSKIWPLSPTTTFAYIGAQSTLYNVNLNGPICNQPTLGCPAGIYANTNPFTNPIGNFPYNSLFADVGYTAGGVNDSNGVVVIERGNGGGIYGQYSATNPAYAGAGIHAYQASTFGAGLRVTRGASGTGLVLDSDNSAAATGIDLLWTNGNKTAGSVISLFHQTSNFVGDLLDVNVGTSGGSFTGSFEKYYNAGVLRWYLDSLGNFTHAGYEAPKVGGAVTSAATITPTGPMFHVTGTAAISGINVPPNMGASGHCMRIIPDAAFTMTTANNIGSNVLAVVGKTLEMCYDPGTSKYYPSY